MQAYEKEYDQKLNAGTISLYYSLRSINKYYTLSQTLNTFQYPQNGHKYTHSLTQSHRNVLEVGTSDMRVNVI